MWLGAEAGKRLEADNAAFFQIINRLIDHRQAVAVEHCENRALQPPATPRRFTVALDKTCGHIGKHTQHVQVTLIKRLVRRVAKAAERAVDAAVAKANRYTQMGAYRERMSHRK